MIHLCKHSQAQQQRIQDQLAISILHCSQVVWDLISVISLLPGQWDQTAPRSLMYLLWDQNQMMQQWKVHVSCTTPLVKRSPINLSEG